MPITLGCPSCGKRFRARDESAGKKVKCPYCQSAVQVPSPDESASAGAPTAPLPTAPVGGPPRSSPGRPLPPPPAPVVATPDDWGALPTGPNPPAVAPPAPPPPPAELFPPSLPAPGARGARGASAPSAKERPKPRPKSSGSEKESDQTPEQIAATGWKTARRGLFWVQFGLFFLALIGFVGFGKMVAARTGNDLPTGEGWAQIEGYVNDAKAANAIKLTKTDELNLAMYGGPVLLGGVLIVFGRLIASGAPRSSGACGMFALSGLFLLIGLVGLILSFYFDRLLLKEEQRYAWTGFLLLVPVAEFWFLTGITACGLALKRPKVARAVGAVGFLGALGAFAATIGWELYVQFGRPKVPDADILLYEQAALMLGWLLLVGVYWRAVRNVRLAAREYLDTVAGA